MKGWSKKRLVEITEKIGSGATPRGGQEAYKESGISLFRSLNVYDGIFKKKNLAFIDEDQASKLSNVVVREGDVLLNITGASVARCCVAPSEFLPARVNQHVAIIRPKLDYIDSNFLAYLLASKQYKDALLNTGEKAGSTRQALTKVQLENFEITIPRLPEQNRIVAILDEAFERIDRTIANTKKNLTNARELFESYLNAIFIQKGDGWVESKLGDVCKFQGGSQPPKSVFSIDKKEGYIRLIQIRDYKSDKYIVYIPKEKAKRFCKPDDVMIGRYGPPLFQILRGLEGAYNVALMKAIPTEDFVSKDFLFYFLKNRNILNYIINSSSRTAGQTGLNKATIEPYPIAFPTLEKQAIIVAQLQELKAETQRLEAIYQQKLAALNELKQTILQKAFAGELTADIANQATKNAEGAIAA